MGSFDPKDNNIAAAVAAGIASAGGEYSGINLGENEIPYVVLVPDGQGSTKLIDLTQYAPRPRSNMREMRVSDVPSFVAYVNKWKTDETVVTIADDQASAIIDYGRPAAGVGWGVHKCAVWFQHAPEWELWTGNADSWLTQRGFAEFLEENAGDVLDPDAAGLLEIVTDLEGHSNATLKNAVRLDNGQRELTYIEDINVTSGSKAGNVVIPTSIKVALRVYKHDAQPRALTALLKYKVVDGRVSFMFTFGREVDDTLEIVRQEWQTAITAQINGDGSQTTLANPQILILRQ